MNKKELYEFRKQRGIEINQTESHIINSEICHGIKIVIPYTQAFSKNKVLVGKQGRIIYWKDRREAIEELAWRIKAMRHKFYQGRIWLRIEVYKPNHIGDALNVIDSIADAVEKGIGVNDRWFSIECLAWQIDKADPRIELWIKQKATEHHDICSLCGRELSIDNFPPRVQEQMKKSPQRKIQRKWCNECFKLPPSIRKKQRPHNKLYEEYTQCAKSGCTKKPVARMLCGQHYQQLMKQLKKSNDKNLDGSFESTKAEDGKGRVEVEIKL